MAMKGNGAGYYVFSTDMGDIELLRAVQRKVEEDALADGWPQSMCLATHNNEVYGSYAEARGAVECLGALGHGNHGVMFRDVDSLAPSAEVQDLRERLRVAMAERRAFVRGCRHGIVHSGTLAECDCCGLPTTWEDVIDGDYRCPACGSDLLPASVRARISAYDAQVSSLRRDLHKKEAEQVRLAPVKWLVRHPYRE